MENIIKNKNGFLILETLVAAGIMSIFALAIFKTLDISLLSANTSFSIVIEQDLKRAIRKSFSGVSCEKNMESILGDSFTELKFYNSSTDTGTTLVKKGLFKEKLDIVKITLETESSDPSIKKITTYFKRKGLKALYTKDQRPCTETDLSGCYADNCKMVYRTGGTDDICSLLSCSSGENALAGITCEDGQYLKGFDITGGKICKDLADLWSCPSDAILEGFNSDGSPICGVLPASVLVTEVPPEPPEEPSTFTVESECAYRRHVTDRANTYDINGNIISGPIIGLLHKNTRLERSQDWITMEQYNSDTAYWDSRVSSIVRTYVYNQDCNTRYWTETFSEVTSSGPCQVRYTEPIVNACP